MTDSDLQELAGQRNLARQGRLRQRQDAFRLCATDPVAKKAGMITNVHTGGASLNLRIPFMASIWSRCSRTCRFTSMAGRSPCQTRFRVGDRRDKGRASRSCRPAIFDGAAHAQTGFGEGLLRPLPDRDRHADLTGVMPQGMIKTIAEMSCLQRRAARSVDRRGDRQQRESLSAQFRFLQPGKDADILLLDAALAAQRRRP